MGRKSNNEGSIRQRSDGRFEVRITGGIDFETGKPKRISYYAKTKAEAVKKLHEEEYKLHFQEHVDPTSTKFIDWLRLWLETYMRNSLKQSTYVSYKGYIENHIAPAFPNLKLKDLSVKLLQDFYNYKLTVQGLSPKTIANLHRCLHKAMKQAVLEHYIDFNPCDAINLPRNEKPQIEILTREEQQRLMYTSYNFRYGIFIRLTLATGIRLGELLGLRWEDIDTKNSMLNIRRTLNRLPKVDYNGSGNSTEIVIQEPKTKNSVRSIPLIRNLLNELLQWRNVQLADSHSAGNAYCDSGFIVTNLTGGYIEPRTFKDYYDEILEASGLEHYTFHALRHTFASRALEQGMDNKTLSTILGHHSVAFTLDTYTHVLDSQKHEEMNLMAELFNMPTATKNQSYPVVVTPSPNGFILNPVDFNDLTIEADNIQYGINCIQSAIAQKLTNTYPPAPTPTSEINLNPIEFVVMINT
ncbi:MAG: site-specific integrase [Ruminococcus sp.]|nr:site-specific integrase [Ruminococcus sp.]